MRAFWLRCVSVLLSTAMVSTVARGWTAEDTKDEPEPRAEEPAAPETLGKLTLTLDAGGHTHIIKKVLFTPDGKQLISGSGDHSIRIWDVETGQMLRVLRPPGEHATLYPALSPDGKLLAVNGRYLDGKTLVEVIHLIRFADGRIERVLKGHKDFITAVAFSHDGERVASSSNDNTVRVWNVSEGAQTHEFKTKSLPLAVAFSPDGSRLVHSQVEGCGIRDLATGKVIALEGGKLPNPGWSLDNIAWSPDGTTIASASLNGLRLWDPNGRLRRHVLPGARVQSVAFSADSRRLLATVWDREMRVHLIDVQATNPALLFAPKDLLNQVPFDGAISPDGTLAATSHGTKNHAIVIWKTSDGSVVKRLAARAWLVGRSIHAGWSSNGHSVVWRQVKDPADWTGGPNSFDLVDLHLGPHRAARILGALLQFGHSSVKVAKGSIHVLKDGKSPVELKLPEAARRHRAVSLVNKDRAAVTGSGNGFFLFDSQTGKLIRRVPHPGSILSLAPSPDGRYIMSLAEDQTLRVWDARQGELLLTLYVSSNDWIIWTPKGYYAATPGGERLMGWTVDNGIDKETIFYPSGRFHKQMYRPDVIKRVLEKGSVEDALAAANAVLLQEGHKVAAGEADLNQQLPPRATLQILDSKDLPKVTVKATAVAAVPNQPVTALRLLVDGRPLSEGGSFRAAEGQAEARDEWTITLPPGKHRLSVLARSPDASAVSAAVEITCADPKKQPTLHVLCVGVSAYEDKTLRLDFAAKDAQDLAATFQKCCKGEPYREVLAQTLVNAKASKAAVLQAIADLRKQVKANDLAVVFFAGHGVKFKDQFYLLPADTDTRDMAATAVSGPELRKALGAFPCQVLLMLDACNSSRSLKSFRSSVDDLTRTMTDDECGVAVLCAAMANELAQEKDGNGLFTRAVIDALSRAEGVPFNQLDRMLYVHHLHSFVFDTVSGQSEGRQHPFLSLPWVVESFPVARFAAKPSRNP